jgi:hypothetical protein
MKPGDVINVSPINKETDVKDSLMCPMMFSFTKTNPCIEEKCAWWNSHFAYCSVRGVHDLIYYLQQISKAKE